MECVWLRTFFRLEKTRPLHSMAPGNAVLDSYETGWCGCISSLSFSFLPPFFPFLTHFRAVPGWDGTKTRTQSE